MLTDKQLKARLAKREFPRVTEESIRAKIDSVNFTEVKLNGVTCGTQCVIVMKNGWMSTGFSAPADPRNFDSKVGERYAFDDAFKPLWQLEGYLLREKLHHVALMNAKMSEVPEDVA